MLSIAGGVVGGLSSLAEGLIRASGERARARALRARASQLSVARRLATDESRRQGVEVLGAQVAHRGFAGVTMSGSSLDVLAQTAADAERNTRIIDYNYTSAIQSTFYAARLAEYNADLATLGGVSGLFGGVASGFAGAVS